MRLSDYRNENEDLRDRISQYESDLRRHSRTPSSRQSRRQPQPRQLTKVVEQFNDISKTLSYPARGTPRATRLTSSVLESQLADDSSHIEVFSDLLRQIQSSLETSLEDKQAAYNDLLREHNRLQDQNVSRQMYNRLASEVDKKNEELVDLEENFVREINGINETLADVEHQNFSLMNEINDLKKQNALLADMANENNRLKSDLTETLRDNKHLQEDLESKEKEVKSLCLDFSNCESELASQTAENRALQDRVKSMKVQLDSYVEDMKREAENAVPEELITGVRKLSIAGGKLDYDESKDLISQLLRSMQECYDKHTTLDNLPEQVSRVFESIKGLEEQLHQANELNTELTDLLEEKEQAISDLHKKIDSSNERISTLNEQIKDLEEEIDSSTTKYESDMKALTERLEDKIKSLELDLEDKEDYISELQDDRERYQNDRDDLETLSNENYALEAKNSELNVNLTKARQERDKLQQELRLIGQNWESAEISSNDNISKLETALSDKNKQISELVDQLKQLGLSQDVLSQRLEAKETALEQAIRQNKFLSTDLQSLTKSYNGEVGKVKALKNELRPLVQVTSNSSSGKASRTSSSTSVVELEREVQSLEKELKANSLKYSERGSDFFSILCEILTAVHQSVDKVWQDEISAVLDKIHSRPGTAMENYKILGDLILKCVRHLRERDLNAWHDLSNSHQLSRRSSQPPVTVAHQQHQPTDKLAQVWLSRYREMNARFMREQELRVSDSKAYDANTIRLEKDLEKYKAWYEKLLDSYKKLDFKLQR